MDRKGESGVRWGSDGIASAPATRPQPNGVTAVSAAATAAQAADGV